MSDRKRIYVAYVGGTIGMKPTDNGYAPVPGHLDGAGPRPPELNAREVPELSITEYEPLLDSANARPADWLRIARDIAEHRHSYDGFVVLHGTDTMAYTASALAFLLRGLGKPVVVTGSQIPLGVLRSDGRQNLLTACSWPRATTCARSASCSARRSSRGAPRGQGQRERLRGVHLPEPAAARRRRACRSRSTSRACAPASRGAIALPLALDAPVGAAAPVPRDAGGAAARGDGRADQGPGDRGLRRRDVRRRRPVAVRRARRRRAARRRGRRRQPVRRRPRGPRRVRHERPADPRRARSAGST